MTEGTDKGGDVLSPAGTVNLLRLLAGADGCRLSSATIDGRTVWIKRFDGKTRSLSKRLHRWLSPLLPLVFRSCAPATGKQAARREVRKAAGFRGGGFATPTILYENDSVIVMSEVGQIAEKAMPSLRKMDPSAHDALLVQMAAALGRAHARGLCHGRPHPRDMFFRNGNWGFLDFEEEPEAIMPLAMAQARDVGILFMQIVRHALHTDTPGRALSAYRREAPAAALPELERMVDRLSILLPGLRFLRPLGLGKDGQAILGSISFLREALRKPAGTQARSKTNEIGKTT